jgi:putative amide transporter protein
MVGLLYVGAVLFLNGTMLLGWTESRSAAPMNLMVGALQVITPTYLIFTADGNVGQILGASGLYLFGFTYLYVAFNLLAGLDGRALGYFSGFVAVCAVVFAGLNFWHQIDGVRWGDNAFGVIWLYWAFLWALFFVLLALGKDSIGRYTGAVAAIQGWVTGAAPAFLLLTGHWAQYVNTFAVVLAVFGVVVFGGLYFTVPRLRQTSPTPTPAPAAA